MKVAMLRGPRDLRIEDEADRAPEPGPQQVLVRTLVTGISTGTIQYAPAVTHEIHFSELPAIFERHADGDRTMGAVAVHWE